jgi:hypothetical protein
MFGDIPALRRAPAGGWRAAICAWCKPASGEPDALDAVVGLEDVGAEEAEEDQNRSTR